VVFCDPAHAEGFAFLRKQTLQLASKGRFLAAQFVALLEGDLWRRSAQHANAMAARLADALLAVPGVRLTQPVQANGVFAILPPGASERVRRDWYFYTWDESTGEVRLMCSWDTTEAEVDAFAAAVAHAGETARTGS
jgi:threonine aldolase